MLIFKLFYFDKITWNNALAFGFYIGGILLFPIILTSYLYQFTAHFEKEHDYILLFVLLLLMLWQVFYMCKIFRTSFLKNKTIAFLISTFTIILFYSLLILNAYIFEELEFSTIK